MSISNYNEWLNKTIHDDDNNGDNGYNRNHKKYIYLASIAGSSISTSITYTVFLTKMQKGKPPKMDLPLL